MEQGIRVRSLREIGEREIQGLCDVLIDCVEGGASVSFMLPMTRAKAEAFWSKQAAAHARGERIVAPAAAAWERRCSLRPRAAPLIWARRCSCWTP
jgi:hypothetical protein